MSSKSKRKPKDVSMHKAVSIAMTIFVWAWMSCFNPTQEDVNKLSAEVGGKTLLCRALEAVPSRSFCRVTVVTQYDEAAALAESFGFDVVRNDRPEEGLSRTVHLGTEAMADCDAILYQVADQPLLEQETVRREIEYFRAHPDHIVGLAHNGVRGNPCIFPRKFFPELMALEGDVGGNVVIRAHPEELLLYETSAAELRDVDTVEALAAVQEDRQI